MVEGFDGSGGTSTVAYDLSVADVHTLPVATATGSVLVHNCAVPDGATPGDVQTWSDERTADTCAYLGLDAIENDVYVGITSNVARRKYEHGPEVDLRQFTPDPLTRHQARAIEQAVIETHPGYGNNINSISPNRDIYAGAVEWGNTWLVDNKTTVWLESRMPAEWLQTYLPDG